MILDSLLEALATGGFIATLFCGLPIAVEVIEDHRQHHRH